MTPSKPINNVRQHGIRKANVKGQKDYYTKHPDRLMEELRPICQRLAKKNLPFHQDNAPPHTSNVTSAKLFEIGFEIVTRPPYSPDLAPFGFLLFPNLKNGSGGRKKFSSNKEVFDDINGYFEDFETTCFSEGIKKSEHRLARYVNINKYFFENKNFTSKECSLFWFYLTLIEKPS
ncbi:hypothetical protein LAZ67_5002152 [Cordylochernes scorpioides]|uniref:Transposase n=1 Tax=Cordylochernes scorpioides TaxID=51811 RepID=A0ABY6KG41_9ARAC|nr:hypothetical protein LAZ67_5002152 [Cordylochernes scorpioides]